MRENTHCDYEDTQRIFEFDWKQGYTFCGPNYLLELDDTKGHFYFPKSHYKPPDWCPFILEHALMEGERRAR